MFDCPRCGKRPHERNLYSLFFPVQICRSCATEEAKGKRRPWHLHPEIAQHSQETLVDYKYVRRYYEPVHVHKILAKISVELLGEKR